jgi:hypothetical protein
LYTMPFFTLPPRRVFMMQYVFIYAMA